MTDMHLPPGDVRVNSEFYAYHKDMYAKSSERYMLQTRRALGRAAEAKAGDYIQEKWKLDLLRRTIDDSFRDVDLVVLPTRKRSPRTIERAIEREEADVPRNPELENTQAFNPYGIPTISIPCGFTSDGVPIGLMIAGPRFAEGKVLALARAFERATDFHERKPPLAPDTPVPPLAEEEPPRKE
jgi:aspartyl-tRNA(Asn)/glutamyl-tRNA(Gln) amidotransferase subunit A